MDKKQLLWILLLSFGAALLVQKYIFPPKQEAPQAPAPTAEKPAPAPADTTSAWIFGGKGLTDKQLRTGQTPTVTLGSLDPDGDYDFQLQLDPRGASIRTLKLAGYFQTVKQKRAKDKTPEQLEQWSYALLAPTAVPGGEEVLPFSTQAVVIDGRRVNTFLGPKVSRWEKGADKPVSGRIAWEPGQVTTDADGTQSVSFFLKLYADLEAAKAQKPAYRLIKSYAIARNSHSLRVTLKVENLTGETQTLSVRQYGACGIPREGLRADVRDVAAASLITEENKVAIGKDRRVDRAAAVKRDVEERLDAETLGDNRADTANPALWAANGNQFFTCLTYPVPAGIDTAAVTKDTPLDALKVPADEYTFEMLTRPVGDAAEPDSLSQLVEINTDDKTCDAGEAASFSFDVYCGPKSGSTFKNTPLYHRLNYTKAIKFRTCNLCLIEPLAHAVMWIIERGGAAIGNYGVIIILMVLLIRLALHPITKRSQVSMMKMKKLQPEMQKIQEKYKDDKQAQQKAMMEFWKQTGASPFLGCLPMFLQMPIWIALWGGLSASVVLRHEGLLPFWITDLAGADTVIALAKPYTLPLIGGMIGPIHGLNLLPLMLAAAMFLQQKLTPMQSAASASPDQQRQQKMMMYMMSIMMLMFFYNAPSGLTLYIMASTAGGVVESYVIRKHIAEREALEAADETRVSIPGKVARGKRPKKPKGPFKM